MLVCGDASPAAAAAAGPGAAYRISGVAVNARDGAPIPYCRLQVSEVNEDAVQTFQAAGNFRGPNGLSPRRQADLPEVEADAHGRFRLDVGRAGSWLLSGSAREYQRQAYGAHENLFAAIVLTKTAPAAEVVLRLQRDAQIQGLVLDEAGDPVRRAQVVAERLGAGESRQVRTAGNSLTDDRGRYELDGLLPGFYRVRVQAQPWYAQSANERSVDAPAIPLSSESSADPSLDVVYPPMWYPGVSEEGDAGSVSLSGGEERQVDFHLSPVPAAHLTVPLPVRTGGDAGGVLRPQRGAALVRVSPAGGFGVSSVTNGGLQEFAGLAPGLYEVRTFEGDADGGPDVRQIRVTAGGRAVLDTSATPVLAKLSLHVDGGGTDQLRRISFLDRSSGRSVMANGSRGQGFRGGEPARGSDGTTTVSLSPGRWQVRVAPGGNAYLSSLSGVGLSVEGSTIVVEERPAALTLHLASGLGTVNGRVLLAGKPVEGAMVLLVPSSLGDVNGMTETSRAESNTDGSFAMRGIVPGRYILLAIAHGWEVHWQETAVLLPYLAHGLALQVEGGASPLKDVVAVEP